MDINYYKFYNAPITILIKLSLFAYFITAEDNGQLDLSILRKEAHSMFMHGYRSYMNNAYPADELMPLSCKGRVRGVTPSRGNIDDSLGNFSLTLLDSMDTLVVMNEFDEFEKAIKAVIRDVRFDSDLVVSVFETNIRVLGGLISAHIMADLVKSKHPNRLKFYDKQLLKMAIEVGDRLLPAFNTTSGLPYSRINLKHGMVESLKRQKDTCTACGGTMLLEMAALSRLTGNSIYENKARKAMDFLWQQRHRSSDLMGTVLNVHSGDWVRRESGIGAGIDSYYEYCLKAYILLGDPNYLERFNKHYEAIMRYVNKGPLFVDVHMHRPTVATRGFMDSLLAFWPGLQVLKGDVKEAIEMHEMLFQVIQKHKFLPEAFTHDFQIHWAEHPLRPEFVESTYFLYRATKDPHYLHVAKQIMESINEYVRVPCGFASLKDVRTMSKEDQMESFVLSETFKYLYMIFTEPEELIFDPDHFVLTTEAHFLPLSMGTTSEINIPRRMILRSDEPKAKNYVCANPIDFTKLPTEREEAKLIREKTKLLLGEIRNQQLGGGTILDSSCETRNERLKAWAFSTSNQQHLKQLADMGIELVALEDGRIHLTHHSANAINPIQAKWGSDFMQEMMQYVTNMEKDESHHIEKSERYVQVVSSPNFGKPSFYASPAQFGIDVIDYPVVAKIIRAEPFRACSSILNAEELKGKIALVERSDCMFQEKARNVQKAGAVAMLVIDHESKTRYGEDKPSFAMAGDKDAVDDIAIPSLFIYRMEGEHILSIIKKNRNVILQMSSHISPYPDLLSSFLKTGKESVLLTEPQCQEEEGEIVVFDKHTPIVVFNLRLNGVTQQSEPVMQQEIVERHVSEMQKYLEFGSELHSFKFYEFFRNVAYGALDLNVDSDPVSSVKSSLGSLTFKPIPSSVYQRLVGDITRIRCIPKDDRMTCTQINF